MLVAKIEMARSAVVEHSDVIVLKRCVQSLSLHIVGFSTALSQILFVIKSEYTTVYDKVEPFIPSDIINVSCSNQIN